MTSFIFSLPTLFTFIYFLPLLLYDIHMISFSFCLLTLFSFIFFFPLLPSFTRHNSVSLFPLYSPSYTSSIFYTHSQDLIQFLCSHFIRLFFFLPLLYLFTRFFSFSFPTLFTFTFFRLISILIHKTSFSFCLPTLVTFIYFLPLISLFSWRLSVSLFPLYTPSYSSFYFYFPSQDIIQFLSSLFIILHICWQFASFKIVAVLDDRGKP